MKKKMQKKMSAKISKKNEKIPLKAAAKKTRASKTKAAVTSVTSPAVAATSTRGNFNEQHPYYHVLNQVIDPEVGVGIADMGLIYDVTEKKGIVDVKMTLTSMGCPAGPDLVTNIDAILRLEPGVKDVLIEVVWDPMWTPDMMKPELREMLFGGLPNNF